MRDVHLDQARPNMLGVTNVAQHNSAKVWIPGIDAQLYLKCNLDDNEIASIKTKVAPVEWLTRSGSNRADWGSLSAQRSGSTGSA